MSTTTSAKPATRATSKPGSDKASAEKVAAEPQPIAEHIDQLVARAKRALAAYADFDQEQIDHIVAKASVAALNKHGVLAKHAVEETGRGLFEDKAVKNLFACEHVTHSMKKVKTVGVINRDELNGVIEIAEPVGVVAAVTPVTNPTSTAIFKALLAIKTRNPIIFGFHPGAQNSCVEAATIVRDAAIAAGAPADCVQWVATPSVEATGLLMNHPGVALILATGGNAMVKAAYSAGKPAIGVGAGNVPAYVHVSANLKRAANDLVMSKSFDNGMVCASEQAAVLDDAIYEDVIAEMVKLHAYRCTPAEKALLEEFAFGAQAGGVNCGGAKLNASIVGQSAAWIAERAGFTVPADTSILLAEADHVGFDEPLTREKLCPILTILRARTTADGLALAEAMVELDGLGHSAAIHADDDALVEEFGKRMKAVRIIVNAPSSLGGIGDIYNAFLPSLTLGCGSYGSNSVSNNVSAVNLINVKRIARRNNNMQWFKVPPKIYFEPNSVQYLAHMPQVERVLLVTDATMTKIGVTKKILDVLALRPNAVATHVIDTIEPEPTISTVTAATEVMRTFKPDTIVALGGGSPMDAAKVMWLMYEHPEIEFADLREKFFDVRKRAFTFPALGELAKLVCIPTTSGTGSEVTPFAVITDPDTGYKYPLADYALTPSVAICDPVMSLSMPRSLAADSGFDALTHATEAYVSVYANDFTDGLALRAIKLIFENISASVNQGAAAKQAREKMHNAGTMAGMAFGSAFLGIVHAMAHTIGATYHKPHGRSNAVLLPLVIRYNGQTPTKLTSWPKYEHYVAPERYQQIAQMLGLPASTPEEGVESYAKAVEALRDEVGIERSFQALNVDESAFIGSLERLAYRAYEDQCAPANPRMPMIDDMKILMEAAYYGTSYEEVVASRAATSAAGAASELAAAQQ